MRENEAATGLRRFHLLKSDVAALRRASTGGSRLESTEPPREPDFEFWRTRMEGIEAEARAAGAATTSKARSIDAISAGST